MAKELNLMASNTISEILLLLCFLGNISCAYKSSNKEGSKKLVSMRDTSIDKPFPKTVTFIPDSTINGILILNNSKSARNFYPEISSEKLIDRLRESPVLALGCKNKEYLLLYQYEGGTKDEFGCFEIGYISDLKRNITTTTNYKSFETESGLKLGLSFKELVKIKGRGYTKEGNKFIYEINDYSKSDFLKRYNMPAYFLECTFQNSRINKIKFGFVFP